MLGPKNQDLNTDLLRCDNGSIVSKNNRPSIPGTKLDLVKLQNIGKEMKSDKIQNDEKYN